MELEDFDLTEPWVGKLMIIKQAQSPLQETLRGQSFSAMKIQYYVGLFVVVLSFFLINGLYEKTKSDSEFKQKKFNGQILELTEQTRGYVRFLIRDHDTNDTLDYSLMFYSPFLEENNIAVGDSVSKAEMSSVVSFFKKKNEKYEKCCEFDF
jgi:hypothetical protein